MSAATKQWANSGNLLSRNGMLKPTPSPFTILGIEEVGPKPDGTPRRNRWGVMVEVDGCVHRILIRRSRNQVHIPLPLWGYPALSKLKRAVKDVMAPVIKAAQEDDIASTSSHEAPDPEAKSISVRDNKAYQASQEL